MSTDNLKPGTIIMSKKTGLLYKLESNLNNWWFGFSSLRHQGVMQISKKGLKRYKVTDLNEQTARLIEAL